MVGCMKDVLKKIVEMIKKRKGNELLVGKRKSK